MPITVLLASKITQIKSKFAILKTLPMVLAEPTPKIQSFNKYQVPTKCMALC